MSDASERAGTPSERRQAAWATCAGADAPVWDVLIVGGGITGAGIALEAARVGLRTLLVERGDFAHGTSSRSSKLVHGGLRYLAQGKVGLVRAAVRERERLLRAADGLVTACDFLLLDYRDAARALPRLTGVGLRIYDAIAGARTSSALSTEELLARVPGLSGDGLRRGFRHRDAQTDDARLVLRVLADAEDAGARALNYAQAREVTARPLGAQATTRTLLEDRVTGTCAEVHARLVINATGAWADRLRAQLGRRPRMRPLRGSHLVFPSARLPVPGPISTLHPDDRRPVFVIPWEGVTFVGTTDLDHEHELDREPCISGAEVSYLMRVTRRLFPEQDLELDDILSSWAGVRPVVGSGQANPSRESRDHVVWHEDGLLTVTGGKLTTFRLIAQDTVNTARDILAEQVHLDRRQPTDAILEPMPPRQRAALDRALASHEVGPRTRARILGRHGARAHQIVAEVDEAGAGEGTPYRRGQVGDAFELVPGTTTTWAELRWSARHERVVHLDDLLLRRTRIGLCTPEGGAALLPAIRDACQRPLAWSDATWEAEVARYRELWSRHYSLPPRADISSWR